MWQESLKELKSTKSIVLAGLLSALNVILGGVLQITLVPQVLYLSFGYLSVSALGYLCGPVIGAIAGVMCDILKYIVNPQGSFFLGFTLNELLTGIIYGVFLYHQKPTVKRCFACRFTIILLINILLTPLWLNMLYGNAWIVYASSRIVKNLILFPIESILMYYTLKLVSRIKKISA